MSIELGNCALYITAKNFENKSPAVFYQTLRKNYYKVSPFSVEEGQKQAWLDCYNVLQQTFSALPDSFGNLWMVFEYVLPQHNPASYKFDNETHILADVILVSADNVLVLEFKQYKEPFIGFFHQAKKYKTRIEKYHCESNNMTVDSLLVLSKAQNCLCESEGIVCCSSDNLSNEIRRVMGETPKPHPNIQQWLQSDFSGVDYDSETSDDDDEENDAVTVNQLKDLLSKLEALNNKLTSMTESLKDIEVRLADDLYSTYNSGTRVYHSTFGIGTVVELRPCPGTDRLIVHFENRDSVFLFPDCVEKGFIHLAE